MASSFDIEKLTHILQENESDSDTASVDSNELEIDCELYDILKDTKDDTIKNCKDPLIKQALICNVKKRRTLEQIVLKLENHLLQVKQLYKECRSRVLIESKSKHKPRINLMKKRLGIPYFKDRNAFPSPANADYLKIKNNNQFVQNELVQNIWLTEDKHNLLNGVINDVCAKRLEEIKKQIEKNQRIKSMDKELIESLDYGKRIFSNTDLIVALNKKWGILYKLRTEDTKDSEKIAEQLILQTVCVWKKIDWLQVSSRYVDGRHSDIECEAMWNCYMNPKFSKESWKILENKKLIELSEKYNYQNWDAIAVELNTDRSGYQCCVHFHAKLCDKFHRDKWTHEEDEHLQSIVENCRVGNYISWAKVAYYFSHRTKLQIYRHYTSCMLHQVKKGAFSVEEDILLLTAMKIYNGNTKKVGLHFPDRIPDQLRSRLKTLNTSTGRPWTAEDDATIIHYVSVHGQKNWKVLKEELNRSEACIRHRYRIIQKYIELNTTIYHIPRREYKNTRTQMRQRHKLVKKVATFLVHKLKRTKNLSSYLNLDYIKEIIHPFLHESKSSKDRKSENKSLPPAINIHYLLSDFFKSSYKKIIRKHEVIDENYINSSADRVQLFLQILGANLVFPSLDQIKNNPMLDDTDIKIITQLISKQESNVPTSNQPSVLSIPPSIENLVGFRGILLHMPVLKNHARGRYMGYTIYAKTEPNIHYNGKGYFYNKRKLETSLLEYDNERKDVIVHHRQLFFHRLQLLFKWPLMIADTRAEPVTEKLKAPEEPKEKPKRGRTPKNIKNYKIKLMNEARKNSAAEKRKLAQMNENDHSKKIKLG